MRLSVQPRRHGFARAFVQGLGAVVCTGLVMAACEAPAGEAKKQPAQAVPKPQTGQASYYGTGVGDKTASGAKFNPKAMTAASPHLPLGTKAKVTNLENGKSVAVTVTDRGPYVKGRIIDVTPKAADHLDMKDDGVAPVKVEPKNVPKATD